MAITLTPISKSSTVSFTAFTKSSSSGTGIEIGNPMGLLLSLTYASAIAGVDGLVITLINKN
jgi:hypothetical protein